MNSPMNSATAKPAVRLIDVNAVAQKLDCSSRHVYRLEEEQRMPRASRLGTLVRWPESAIDGWIESGCPDCKDSESN